MKNKDPNAAIRKLRAHAKSIREVRSLTKIHIGPTMATRLTYAAAAMDEACDVIEWMNQRKP